VAFDEAGLYQVEGFGQVLVSGLSASDAAERIVYEVTLALAAGCRTHLVCHAAGLARGEQGLILCGESGSGKSTLAAHLAARGWDFLSDELVAIAPDGGELLGFPRALNIKDLAPLAELPPLAESAGPSRELSSGPIAHLDPADFCPGRVRARARPALLLFPRYSAGDPPELRPLSAAHAAYRLMPRLLNASSLPDRGFAAAVGLARHLPAWTLTYGDAATAVERLESLGRLTALDR
jgi:hypothetical protein